MPYDRTTYASGWGDWGMIFYQLYHTPISELKFWVCGLADGDYIDLSDWFEELFTAHASFCNINGTVVPTAAQHSNLGIILASGGNAAWVQIFHSSGLRLDVQVTGHKVESNDALLY